MKALNDKAELKARNQAYKVTLEYCDETCDDVDELFTKLKDILVQDLHDKLSYKDMSSMFNKLDNLNTHLKDVGTRKLRKAFVNYVLEQQERGGYKHA